MLILATTATVKRAHSPFNLDENSLNECSTSLLNRVPSCLRANVVYMPTCLRASVVYVSTCLRASISFLCTNVPINVPTCHTACQRAKRLADFSTWCANVPKDVPIFQTFLLRNAKEYFYTLL